MKNQPNRNKKLKKTMINNKKKESKKNNKNKTKILNSLKNKNKTNKSQYSKLKNRNPKEVKHIMPLFNYLLNQFKIKKKINIFFILIDLMFTIA
jgi:hypothetical protein